MKIQCDSEKVIWMKRQAQVKENALKTPCLAKRHREAYDDFRLFSFPLFFDGRKFCKMSCFHPELNYPYTTVKMVGNGKCMRFSVYQTIRQLLQNINSSEWLMFKIESHLLVSGSLQFHQLVFVCWTNNNEENEVLFFAKNAQWRITISTVRAMASFRTRAANYGQNLLLIYYV